MSFTTGQGFHDVTATVRFRVWAEGTTDAHATAQSALAQRLRGLDQMHVDSVDVHGPDSASHTESTPGGGSRSAYASGGSVAVGEVHGSVVIGNNNQL